MVMVRDIPFASLCEHHIIPFLGRAHVAYIPNAEGHITGLSKLARLVDGYARRLQVQERMTTQIADSIERVLGLRGMLVVIEAEHLCMSMRGVGNPERSRSRLRSAGCSAMMPHAGRGDGLRPRQREPGLDAVDAPHARRVVSR